MEEEEEEEEEDSTSAVSSAAPRRDRAPELSSAIERHDQGRGGQKLEGLAHTSTDRPSRVPRPRVPRPRDKCDGDVLSQCGAFPEENLRVATPEQEARWGESGYCGVKIRRDNKASSARFYGMKKTQFPAGTFAPALPVIARHACHHTFARDTCSLTGFPPPPPTHKLGKGKQYRTTALCSTPQAAARLLVEHLSATFGESCDAAAIMNDQTVCTAKTCKRSGNMCR